MDLENISFTEKQTSNIKFLSIIAFSTQTITSKSKILRTAVVYQLWIIGIKTWIN